MFMTTQHPVGIEAQIPEQYEMHSRPRRSRPTPRSNGQDSYLYRPGPSSNPPVEIDFSNIPIEISPSSSNPIADTQIPETSPPTATENAQPVRMDFEQKFELQEPKFRDIWAAIAFIIIFCLFVGVSGVSLHGFNLSMSTSALSYHIFILGTLVLVAAFVTSSMELLIIRAFTNQSIYIIGSLQIGIGIFAAVYSYARYSNSVSFVFVILTILYGLIYYFWIRRSSFSALMLQKVIDISKQFGHMFIIALIGGLFATIYSAWFIVTLVAVYTKYHPGGSKCGDGQSCSKWKFIVIVIFISFAGYWITEVIRNVIHTSISGVYSSWFFFSQKPGGVPARPTRGAFKRAITYSFGSICFGSLTVAPTQIIRNVGKIFKGHKFNEEKLWGRVLNWHFQYSIKIANWMTNFLNEYAFSYIPLHGKGYISSARETWGMIRDRRIELLVTHCLINSILATGALFVACLTTISAFLFLENAKPKYNEENAYTVFILIFTFFIGLQIANIIVVPIRSGIATLFAAIAMDMEVFRTEHVSLMQEMIEFNFDVENIVHSNIDS